MLKRVVRHRLFAFADLACVSTSVVLWELEPRFGGWPLLIGLLPWLLRSCAGCFPFQRTRLELPLVIFVLTAAMGVWAAYGGEAARSKFWLLVGGVLLYYAMAGQPRENLWAIAGFLSLVGIGISCYFLFTHDWQHHPAKIGLLNQVGLWWMGVRPAFRQPGVHPNSAAAVIAMSAPYLMAIGVRAWKEKRVLAGMWVVAGAGLISAGFLLATSRGAALALAAGLGSWLLWVLSNQVGRLVPSRPRTIFVVGLIVLALLASVLAFLFPGGPVGLLSTLPGPPSAGSRVGLAGSALKLVGDFPFTGGGLDSFPGLYSTYILGIPFYFTLNSHNVYLDVALEQGLVGALAFCAVYVGAIRSIVTRDWQSRRATLVLAAFSSLLVIVLHGLTDNLVYGRWGAALVFFVPGIACAVARSSPRTKNANTSARRPMPGLSTLSRRRPWAMGAGVAALVALLTVIYAYRGPLLAAWYADLGAVHMARSELAGFPPGRRPEGYHLAELEPAERLFAQALHYDARNRTANHRLGLIATGRRDYLAAVSYLETAYQADENHRGIWKALGYSYVWSGQIDQAVELLANIPEASYELGHYARWWGTQDREDLSERAKTAVERLEGSGSPRPTPQGQ